MEKCTKCTKLKPLKDFYLNNKSKTGFRPWCKECSKKYSHQWRTKKSQKCKETKLQWRLENKEKINKNSKKYREQHKERIGRYCRKWRERNKNQCNQYSLRHRSTEKGKLNSRIRSAIRSSIARGTKNKRPWETLVGFTVDQLKHHLEKQFRDGMSWEKFFNGEIQIDHKLPISKFNFTSPDHIDFKKCWSLKNLQPMWAKENLSKGAKIDKHFQPSLRLVV